MKINNIKLAIVGLGYVGLPLAIEFGKKIRTIGFDKNPKRINQLLNGFDKNLEVSKREIDKSINLNLTSNIKDLQDSNCYIITVPTPIKQNKSPDLRLLKQAFDLISKILKKNDIVILESTVYPGTTEEICVPILEKGSRLKFNEDFFCGYSPERINPGDNIYKLKDIIKITSGSNQMIAKLIDSLYKEIISAGTYMVKSIKIAEAAKVIENVQRDLNIALVNELAIIFNKLKIDTNSVLDAAGTKWNFQKFKPGLVGGHCIGIDPYYLAHKSIEIGYFPKVILSGRSLNESIPKYVSSQFIKKLKSNYVNITNAKVLIMGLTFKENCPDHRNSLVINLINHLKKYKLTLDIHDPWIDIKEIKNIYGLSVCKKIKKKKYDGIIIAVSHQSFFDLGIKNIRKLLKRNGIIYDLKSMFHYNDTDLRL